MPGFYTIIDNYMEALITAMSTPIILTILGIMLLRGVRNIIRGRVAAVNARPVTTGRQTALQKIDVQLTVMFIIQLGIAVTTRIPYAVFLIYTNLTQ